MKAREGGSPEGSTAPTVVESNLGSPAASEEGDGHSFSSSFSLFSFFLFISHTDTPAHTQV